MEFLDQALKFLSSTGLNNIILLGGVIATITTIKHNRTIAQQKETALLLFNSRTDDMLRLGYKVIRDLQSSTVDNIASYATDDTKRNSEQADQIRYVLNHWERTAVCVGHQIYCEKILKDSMFTTVVNMFEQAEPFIKAIRRRVGRETLYQDLECMVKRWNSDPLAKRNPK